MSSADPGRGVPGKGAVLGVTVLTAALLALTVTRTWVSGSVDDPVLGHRAVAAGGSTLAPAALALALAAGAGALAAGVVGRWGRVVAAVVVVGAGVGAVALTVGVGLDPARALERTASGAVGRNGGAAVSDVAVSGWVWVAMALAVLLAIEGITVLVASRRWSGLSARYDAPGVGVGHEAGPGSTGVSGAGVAGLDDEGFQPSGRPSDPGHATGLPPNARRTADDERRRAARAAVADWDRLSAGDDPTT